MKTRLTLVIGLIMLVSAASAIIIEKPKWEPDSTIVKYVDSINLLQTCYDLETFSYTIDLPADPTVPLAAQMPEITDTAIALPELPKSPAISVHLKMGDSYNWMTLLDRISMDEPEAADSEDVVQEDPMSEADPVVQKAQEWLANDLGVDIGLVTVVEVTEEYWPDGCLGLGGPDEACTMAFVPGYKIIFSVMEKEYEVRTDLNGNQIRRAG
ncbi:MAG: hypothetical protein HPY61_11975 [Methanotrichaceae archaeon]|nr:hypothetical protein [Methanotrichaceae archaeon]